MKPAHLDHLHLITGEYPPAPGGIGDHTARLAAGLVESGCDVHVWTGGNAEESDAPIRVHRVAGEWSHRDLSRLGEALDRHPAPRRLFVQYAPNPFGRRGMNLGFCSWLIGRRKLGDDVRILFHEVRYLVRPEDGAGRRFLAMTQRLMVRRLLRAATRVYVTIPFWNKLLSPHARGLFSSEWLPVPSNIPAVDDPSGVLRTREALGSGGRRIIGCFGTFQDVIGGMVADCLPPLLLGRPDRLGLLIGRGSREFAEALGQGRPELNERLIAVGGLSPEDVSRHLQACDLLVQPYPEGVCTKRGSVMAGLANGVPIATTIGRISEPLWEISNAVALAPDDGLSELIRKADQLIDKPDELRRLGGAGRDLYEREFRLGRLVERLTNSVLEPS